MSKTLKASICYLMALLSFIGVRILASYGVFASFTGFLGDLLTTMIIQIICLIFVPFATYRLLTKESITQSFKQFGYKKITSNTFWLCVILGIIAYILNSCFSTFWSFLLSLFGYASRGSGGGATYKNIFDLIISLISTAVLPGFCEEFLHRGLTQSLIKEEKGYVFSAILTGILFGLFHLNIYQTGYATFLGILMGFLTIYAGSIYPAVIIHFMNNAINVLVGYFNDTLPFFKQFLQTLENSGNSISGAKMMIVIFFLTLLIFALIYVVYRIFIKIIKNEKMKDSKYSSNQIAFAVLCFDKKSKASITNENVKNDILNIENELKKIYPITKIKLEFKDYIMLVLILFLATLITIFTLIWGIL